MAKNSSKSPSQWIVQVVVPILVALIGAGFWQYFQPNSTTVCQITASELSLEKTVIYEGQIIKVSIRSDNPKGQPMLYNWQAVYGQMTPNMRSNSAESTYTAPLNAVDDIISVDITLPDCLSVKKYQAISVIYNTVNSSVETTKVTPTLLDSTTPVPLTSTRVPFTPTPEPGDVPTPRPEGSRPNTGLPNTAARANLEVGPQAGLIDLLFIVLLVVVIASVIIYLIKVIFDKIF